MESRAGGTAVTPVWESSPCLVSPFYPCSYTIIVWLLSSSRKPKEKKHKKEKKKEKKHKKHKKERRDRDD
jgi:hypothetical protein